MKLILISALLLLAGCTHKQIAKNCEKTATGEYYVCDSVWYK